MNVSKPLFHCSFACVFCLHFDLTRKTLFTFFNGKFLNVVIFFSWKQQLHRFIDCCGGCWSWQVFSVLVIMMIMFVWWKKQTVFSSVIIVIISQGKNNLPFFNVIFKTSIIPAPNSFTSRFDCLAVCRSRSIHEHFKGRWLLFWLLISNWKLGLWSVSYSKM